jgi:hypothetical protein
MEYSPAPCLNQLAAEHQQRPHEQHQTEDDNGSNDIDEGKKGCARVENTLGNATGGARADGKA